MTGLKTLIHDYPPAKLRESFQLMKTIVKVRNIAGNVFVIVFFGGMFAWIMSRIFPGVNWK
jgi:hypothetical protein